MNTPEDNKKVAMRLLEEIFNQRRLDLLEEVIAPDHRTHALSVFPPAGKSGPEGIREEYEAFYAAIPDVKAEVIDIIAEGDRVVVLDRFGGTHKGELVGRPGTGKRIEWMVYHQYRIVDDKITDDWVLVDALAIMQQAGAIPQLQAA